jgi:hypothetical protein
MFIVLYIIRKQTIPAFLIRSLKRVLFNWSVVIHWVATVPSRSGPLQLCAGCSKLYQGKASMYATDKRGKNVGNLRVLWGKGVISHALRTLPL